MPTIRVVDSTDRVKVAVVFEACQIRPVWFEIAGTARVQIAEICAVWYHNQGAERIATFEIWDLRERYSLQYNMSAMTWSVGKAVFEA